MGVSGEFELTESAVDAVVGFLYDLESSFLEGKVGEGNLFVEWLFLFGFTVVAVNLELPRDRGQVHGGKCYYNKYIKNQRSEEIVLTCFVWRWLRRRGKMICFE